MLKRTWIDEMAEAAVAVWDDLCAFWLRDVWPMFLAVWFFVLLAAPLLLVVLLLWYLDSIGWRAGAGFYTIGSAALTGAVGMLG